MLVGCCLVGVALLGFSAALPTGSTRNDGILEECRNHESDIYFLLDSSSSLMPRDFQKLLNFTASLVQKMDVGSGSTRVGLGVFADNFFPQFDLGEHANTSSVVRAIRQVSYYGGGTYTGRGLLGMRTTGFKEGVVRENATKIGVVITDGKSRHRSDTLTESARLQDRGIWLFAVGVGQGVDRDELSIFASHPRPEFIRHVDTFADLSTLTSDLAFAACRLQPPHADNATCGLTQKTDILFVYNAAAMSLSNLSHVQTFTEDVIEHFSMTSGNVRVGVISEGRRGGDIYLSKFIRKEDLVRAMKETPRAELTSLLRKARQQGFDPRHGGRPNAKKIAVIFVDDVNVSIDALVEARLMVYSDVIVYVIGVGLTGDQGSLEKVKRLPSDPVNFSQFPGFVDLLDKDNSERKKFLVRLCSYM